MTSRTVCVAVASGGTVRGTGADARTLNWPDALDSLPPNRLIERLGESGMGKTIEDNSVEINGLLDDYNGTVPEPAGHGGSTSTGGTGTGGSSNGGTGGKPVPIGKGGSGGGTAGGVGTGGSTNGASGADDGSEASGGLFDAPHAPARRRAESFGGGCGIAPGNSDPLLGALVGLLVVAARRRRRAAYRA